MVRISSYFRNYFSNIIFNIVFISKISYIMKSFIFSLYILLTLSFSISAQNLNSDYSSPKSTIRLSEYKDQWKVSVQPMEMIHPGGNSYQNFLFDEKNKVSLLYPRKKTSSVKKEILTNLLLLLKIVLKVIYIIIKFLMTILWLFLMTELLLLGLIHLT